MQTEGVKVADGPDRHVVIHNKFLHPFRHDTKDFHPIRCRDLCGLEANHTDRPEIRIAKIVDVVELLPTTTFPAWSSTDFWITSKADLAMEKVRVVQSSQNSSPEISPNSSCTSDIHASTPSGTDSPCHQTDCSILPRQSKKSDTVASLPIGSPY
ncbi:hypothetical protein [Streptomyces sp. RKAG290]|uniref:hypothetical protein n=1 Tax=Streptomyces sp. RKAG290 TaxID=2888348 RepID=UPI0020345FA9|nr:hypothetical protein [Streptomyces sp. RKAG290]MCM2411284.1 hypothetical protein [Streptomyces sp. RKAG290]